MSLADCFNKAGKAFNKTDVDTTNARVKELTDSGVEQSQAEQQAVNELVGVKQSELNDIASQAEGLGAQVARADNVAPSFFADVALNYAKEQGFEKSITEAGNLKLFHGSSKQSTDSILNGGEFRGFPFFALDRETAKRFGQQAGGTVSVIEVEVDPASLVPTGGYLTARIEGMKLNDDNVWTAEDSRFYQTESVNEFIEVPDVTSTSFTAAIQQARKASPNGLSVAVFDESEYANMELHVYDNGNAGFAIEYDGTLTGVFKHPDSKIDNAIDVLIPLAIQAGANRLDAFEGFLTESYARHGFKEVRRSPWNSDIAPPGWDEKSQGTPDVIYMELSNERKISTAPYAQPISQEGGLRPSSDGLDDSDRARRNGRGGDTSGVTTPLPGAPVIEGATGPDPALVNVVEQYALANNIDLERQSSYAVVDTDRAIRIAQAYEEMEHNPSDPVVRDAYENLIAQTTAQYQALVDAGYQFYFFDESNDPYDGNPWAAMRELRADRRMGVFSTNAGFGSGVTNVDISDNPLLAETGFTWSFNGEQTPVLANDMFRAVHDAFGHGLEGSGFRSRGEENAWQSHVRLFVGSAVNAITVETRGQNSWLNYGPHGTENRNAKSDDTIFADQKIGLLPDWVMTEGRLDATRQTDAEEFKQWFNASKVVDDNGEPKIVHHGTKDSFSVFDPDKAIGSQFFFTDDKEAIVSGEVGAQGRGQILDVYLSIQNPAGWDEYEKLGIGQIQARGFDGVILPDSDGTTTYIVFDNTDIKSVNNTGQFNPGNPDIYNQESRGYYDPDNVLIRLNEASNPSTFMHEFAHFAYDLEQKLEGKNINAINAWFAKNAGDVASEASEYYNGDITEEDVLQYLQAGTTGDRAVDQSIVRATHEQFARGFETYIMEGKSPSVELRKLFRTMARMLKAVYKSIKSGLRAVNLDDNMRQVFDRILATDEQIATAEARSRYQPLFTDAAMAGMTDKRFKDYQDKAANPTSKATETLREQLMKEITRVQQTWWKEERNEIIADEKDRLRVEPVHVARQRLKGGEDLKLDYNSVLELTGLENLKGVNSLFGMTEKGGTGTHPDEAAGAYGFETGTELLNALMTTPSLQNQAVQNADAEMLARHGDIMNDGSLEQLADEATRNEERGSLLLTEIKALSKGKAVPAIDKQTIKAIAGESIGKLPNSKIFPSRYRAAEVRSAQEAITAMHNGDTDAALRAKTQQVMNFYLWREAMDAKQFATGMPKFAARFRTGKPANSRIGKAGNGYLENIHQILSRFNLHPKLSLKRVQSLREWLKERENDADAILISDDVLDEAYSLHWNEVPIDELRGVKDSIKSIEHSARESNKVLQGEEELQFNQALDRMLNSLNHAEDKYLVDQYSTTLEKNNISTGFKELKASLIKMPWLMQQLDGERVGAIHQLLQQPFNDAQFDKMRLYNEIGGKLVELMKTRTKEDLKRQVRKYSLPQIANEATGRAGVLEGHQILAIALNSGNAGNLRKMLLGEGWATDRDDLSIDNPVLQSIFNEYMTDSDWKFVQSVWDTLKPLGDRLAETHLKATGVPMEKVESTSFITQYGEFEGGYYPIKYDASRPDGDKRNASQLQSPDDFETGGGWLSHSVTAGSRNTRTEATGPIDLNLDVLSSHVEEVIHFVTHYEAVKQVHKLSSDKQFLDSVSRKASPAIAKLFKQWVNDVAKNGSPDSPVQWHGRLARRLRFNTTYGVMGFKSGTVLIQLSGLSNSIAEVGSANMAAAIRETVGGGEKNMYDSYQFALLNSKVMAHRLKTFDREVLNASKDLQGKNSTLDKMRQVSMMPIGYMQTFGVDLPTWHAAYKKGMVDFEGDEQRAFKYADFVIENIQGSGVTKDLSGLMRSNNEVLKMMMMFRTFFDSFYAANRDLVIQVQKGEVSPGELISRLMFMYFVPSLYAILLQQGFDDDDDESVYEKTGMEIISMASNQVPFMGSVAGAVVGGFDYSASPVGAQAEKSFSALRSLSDGELPSWWETQQLVKGAGILAGLPGTSQLMISSGHIYDVLEEGEDLSMRYLLVTTNKDN